MPDKTDASNSDIKALSQQGRDEWQVGAIGDYANMSNKCHFLHALTLIYNNYEKLHYLNEGLNIIQMLKLIGQNDGVRRASHLKT